MIHYIITVFSWFYSYPLINKIVKKSIMGHLYDKTIEYYLKPTLVTPLEEDFIINYKVNSRDYILNCTTETYIKTLEYIKNLDNVSFNACPLLAYEMNEETDTVTDISEKVRKYAGPACDFHVLTEYNVTCADITEHKLIIIKDLKIFSYTGDEYITLRSPIYSVHNLEFPKIS